MCSTHTHTHTHRHTLYTPIYGAQKTHLIESFSIAGRIDCRMHQSNGHSFDYTFGRLFDVELSIHVEGRFFAWPCLPAHLIFDVGQQQDKSHCILFYIRLHRRACCCSRNKKDLSTLSLELSTPRLASRPMMKCSAMVHFDNLTYQSLFYMYTNVTTITMN